MIPMRGRNPRSRVSYLDHRLPGIRRIHFDGDGAAIRGVFYRIMYQIHEGTMEERGVRRSMDSDRSSERKLLLLFVGEHAELIDDMSRQPSKVQGLWRQLDLSRLGAREDQKALDEPREPVYLLQHAADDIAIGDGIKCMLQCHLSHAAHRSEWGTQLVRSIGRETAQSFERILQTGQRVIEDCRELPELVLGVLDRKPFGE